VAAEQARKERELQASAARAREQLAREAERKVGANHHRRGGWHTHRALLGRSGCRPLGTATQ
jgi:hypothetical protein